MKRMMVAMVLLGLCSVGFIACKASNRIPLRLQRIEGTAEHAFDMALLENYAAVVKDATQLDNAWKAFRSKAIADGATPSIVKEVDDAMSGLIAAGSNPTGAAQVARAANAISAPMDKLFSLYNPVVPPELMALDYLGREVLLDGMDSDFSAAGLDVDNIQSTWDTVKDSVVNASGAQVATDYDNSILALRQAILNTDSTALIQDAKTGLEIVDTMEQLF